MTSEDRALLNSSIQAVYDVLQRLPLPNTVPDHELYEPLKELHTAAIDPWCRLVEILGTARTEYESVRNTVALSLHQKAQDNWTRKPKPVSDDFLV